MFKIKSIYLLLILLCVSTVSAATLTTWNNSQSTVDLNFSNNNNDTAYILLPKYINISNAIFNITNVTTQTVIPSSSFGNQSIAGSCIFGSTNERFVTSGSSGNCAKSYDLNLTNSTNIYFTYYGGQSGGNNFNFSFAIAYTNNTVIESFDNQALPVGSYVNISNNLRANYNGTYRLLFNVIPNGVGGVILAESYATNLILNVTPANVTAYISGSAISNTTLLNSTYVTNNFTTILQSYLAACTADSNGYCTVPITITNAYNKSYMQLKDLNITYSIYAGLLTRVRNADTNGLINGSQLILSNTTTQYTTTINYSGNDTVFLPWNVIPTGTVTLTYSATGYDTATYSLTLNSTNLANLTAFLQNTTAANAISVTILVRNTNNVQIENALVEIYRSINGTYMLVGQDYTDGTGQITAVLDSTLLYSLQISKSGYNTRNQTLNPVSSLVTITLSSAVSAVPETPLQNLYWLLEPDLIDTQIQPFSLMINTTTNSLEWYNVTLVMNNGTVLNTTSGSNSNGGKITITYNVSKLYNALSNQTIILKGYFKKVNQSQYQFFNVKIYTLYSIPSFNYTGNASVNAIKDSSVNSNNKPSPLFAGLLVFAIILVVSGSVYMQSGARTPSLALGVIILTFFAYIGWIDWILWLPIVLIALGLAKGEDRR